MKIDIALGKFGDPQILVTLLLLAPRLPVK